MSLCLVFELLKVWNYNVPYVVCFRRAVRWGTRLAARARRVRRRGDACRRSRQQQRRPRGPGPTPWAISWAARARRSSARPTATRTHPGRPRGAGMDTCSGNIPRVKASSQLIILVFLSKLCVKKNLSKKQGFRVKTQNITFIFNFPRSTFRERC